MENRLIRCKWDDPAIPWKEDDLQMAIVRHLRRDGYLFAADFNAGKRNPGWAKAIGLEAGEPDLRIYRANGTALLVELKRAKGCAPDAQRARHSAMTDLDSMGSLKKPRRPEALSASLMPYWQSGLDPQHRCSIFH